MMIVLVCPGPGTTGLIIIIPGPGCDDCVGRVVLDQELQALSLLSQGRDVMIVLVCPGPGTTGLIIIIPGPGCDDCVGMSWTRNYRSNHYYPRAGM